MPSSAVGGRPARLSADQVLTKDLVTCHHPGTCRSGRTRPDHARGCTWHRSSGSTSTLCPAHSATEVQARPPSAAVRRHRAERRKDDEPIADDLRAKIESGELAPGAKLPSDRDPADQYGIARNTARDAVRILNDAGMVLTDHGRGSFVRPRAATARGSRTAKRGREDQVRAAPGERLLRGSGPGAPRDDIPPLADCGRHRTTARRSSHRYGTHGVLEDRHHVMTQIKEEVSARMPRPDETQALQLQPGVPVLDVWHISIDQDGEPYELTRFVRRGDMTGLLYVVPVE